MPSGSWSSRAAAHRKKGSRGGHSAGHDLDLYKYRNSVLAAPTDAVP
ncbi:hypothetical protein [Streptomyces bicolor]|nr:hypothetical protein [Streptomyces bicolor]